MAMSMYKCGICGNTTNNRLYIARKARGFRNGGV